MGEGSGGGDDAAAHTAPAKNIRFQQASYKRGLVLGLTMAEIVLLILFTLLLVLAAVLTTKEREQAQMARKRSPLADRRLMLDARVRRASGSRPPSHSATPRCPRVMASSV